MLGYKISFKSDDEIMMSEGCLTFYYLFLNIKRHKKKIQVQYEDDEGKEINRDFEGMFSQIYQHEYDFFTLGITFVEKVSKLKFDMAKKKAEKMYKRDFLKSRNS